MSDQYEKTKPHKEKMDDDFECRFIVDDKGILDNETGTYFLFIAYDWVDCGIYECCDKLNEQSERIKELEQKLKESCKVYGAKGMFTVSAKHSRVATLKTCTG